MWLIVSLSTLLVMAAPFVLPDRAILSMGRTLSSSHASTGACPLCGMTRAFMAIARGDLDGAQAHNRGAILLYAALLFNGAMAVVFWTGKVRGLYRPQPRHNMTS